MREKKSIAIITARGGSKRIPKKNIKDFCGKPIIAYSIIAALESGIFDEVMVSTDSEEIGKIAKDYGASVPFWRSEETSNDYATTYDVISEVINTYEETGIKYDYACCIYPTAPFITDKKLGEAFNILLEKNVDSVIPVVPYSFPPQRAFIEKEGRIQYQYPQYMNSRSQDLQKIYHDCGQFYFFDVKALKEQKKIVMENCYGILVPEEEVQDIDNMSDWKIAELKYKLLLEKTGNKG